MTGKRPRRFRYLLGDARREATRLRKQAKLWDPVTHAFFDRVGVQRGWRVLEIGPGQGSIHFELRRRVRGPVDAVERSPLFAKRLRTLCARDGFGPDRMWESNLIDADLPAKHYDLIFARWVFLFLPDAEGHLRKLVRALRPGGLLALEDYHRATLALIPRPPEWADFMQADLAFFASQGGDASIATRLPDLYRKVGLDVTEMNSTILTGHPRDPVWTWASTYFLGVLDRYAAFRPFTPAKAARLRRHWLAAQRDPASLLIAPAVLDIVGRRPRR